jgi:archaetidylinositol phosphate synthase
MKFAGDKKFGTSLLAKPEEKLKKVLLPLVPSWLETYHLTATTLLWGLMVIIFGYLATYQKLFLWASSLMIAMQYITDLLDGAIGRKRDTGLVKWGYYMDHFLDFLFLCCMLIGYLFILENQFKYMLFFVLALFGCFMVNSFLAFAATNEFRISYMGIGPTEVRIIFIVVNGLIATLGQTHLAKALPYVLGFSAFGLFVTVFRTQKEIWDIDMAAKAAADAEAGESQEGSE